MIVKIKNNFTEVIKSGINPLVDVAKSGLAHIEEPEKKIIDLMIKIKDDPKYLGELTADLAIEHQHALVSLQSRLLAEQERATAAANKVAHELTMQRLTGSCCQKR